MQGFGRSLPEVVSQNNLKERENLVGVLGERVEFSKSGPSA